MSASNTHLTRQLGLLGLTATGICSMIGASIYIVPFMIQRNVPGIGPYVLPAFLFAAIPAVFAALAYTILASAMPRAGGSYLYASRAIHPYLGFVASFSQWFGLSIVIGVIAYVVVPFFRDVAVALNWTGLANLLDTPWIRVSLALTLLWLFVYVNILGAKFYERTLIPLMILMFILGGIVIISGLSFDHSDFLSALMEKEGRNLELTETVFHWPTFLSAAALLFSSFIGFDSIAQAGGEAKNPIKNLPRAIGLAILSVGLFYIAFTYAVYHAVPWQFVALEALEKDITAAGILSYLLPSGLGVLILLGAAVALVNDLPAMILSVSRLVYSWAEDGVFPKSLSKIHSKHQTPHLAIILSGGVSTIGILGSHFAGDIFLGIDIMVTSMLVNFLLMCLSVILFPIRNPALASQISIFRYRPVQLLIGIGGAFLLTAFLFIHTLKDLNASVSAWYFHSTPVWLIVMSLASVLFLFQWKKLKSSGVDLKTRFSTLPSE
ncbi:APC family permease [Algoriphagus sp. A40]|uniref:APC family permease n=1 Tax=Algoriphagus sp. A40 TaxID=1945863 RepID=UPI00098765BF|nr:APC family permease [Algoriphagus sp. A40]OOG76747.1 amino acid transporter [Algoriphagus sp. A40]